MSLYILYIRTDGARVLNSQGIWKLEERSGDRLRTMHCYQGLEFVNERSGSTSVANQYFWVKVAARRKF